MDWFRGILWSRKPTKAGPHLYYRTIVVGFILSNQPLANVKDDHGDVWVNGEIDLSNLGNMEPQDAFRDEDCKIPYLSGEASTVLTMLSRLFFKPK